MKSKEETVMANKEIRYNNGFVFTSGEGCLEVYVNDKTVEQGTVRTVEVDGTEKQVLSLNGMSGRFAGPSNAKNVLEDAVSEDGTIFMNAAVWGKQAEGIAKILRKGMILRIYGKFAKNEYTNKEGQAGVNVKATAYRVEVAYWGKQTEGETAAETEAPADEAPATAVPF